MKRVVADLETFWSVDHSLSKMNPIAYCMHSDTEIISCSIKVGRGQTQCYFGEDAVRAALNAIDWSDVLFVGHNMSGFDAMIFAWRFGIKPKLWGCTLAMARPHHGLTVGNSLAKLVTHYDLGVKDATALNNTKGKHLKDFTPHELAAMKRYNETDTEQCAALFDILAKQTPAYEMLLIDQTIRMLVRPQFECDTALLEDALAGEKWRKKESLVELDKSLHTLEERAARRLDGVDMEEDLRAMLASAPKFSAFLTSRGVAVPMKPSPSDPNKQVPALAKTDEAFLALQEHDDPVVAAAALARLGVKSTLLESRIGSFLEVAEYTGGKMPIALNYYAAHTGRWGGGLSLNQQNLPRVSGKPTDALRASIRAPKGMKIICADLSGIELRMNMFLWRVPYAMALFQADPEKADLYKKMASAKFGVAVEDVTKPQRQIGKVLHLGCGFGAAGGAFQKVAKIMGGIDMDLEESKESVRAYRAEHPEIVKGWRKCHDALEWVLGGDEITVDPWGLCVTTKGGIRTPKGMIRYPELRKQIDDNGKAEYVYGLGRNATRIYAGRVTENLVQHLSRFVLSDAMLEFEKRTGYPIALTVHDEIVAVVPEREAEEQLATLQGILRTPPAWFPQLITWSEGAVGDTYADAK